jgi:putative flippase GtrA
MSRHTVPGVESTASRNWPLVNPLNAPILLIANRVGGRKAKEVERFLKFAIVGITGAIVDFGVLIVLQTTLFPPADMSGNPIPINVTIATSTAFISAVVNNFTWTRLWVYPDSRSRSVRRQLAQFATISVIGGTARTIWVTASAFWMGYVLLPVALPVIHLFNASYAPSPTAEGKLGSIVAQMIGMVVVMLWNFFANRYWTYNDVE